MAAADREAYLWITEHRVGWLDPVFVGLTVAGYAGVVWIALAVVVARASRRRVVPVVAATAAAVWTVDLVVPVLKETIGRPRPSETMPGSDPLIGYTVGDSMPSGHAATSFAGAIVLALFFRRLLPFFLALAAAVAFSRVYVGVHYPTDVVAGAALGSAWALAGLAVVRAARARRRRRATPAAPTPVLRRRPGYPVEERGGGSSVGRAPGCGPGGRGFESHPPPSRSGRAVGRRSSA